MFKELLSKEKIVERTQLFPDWIEFWNRNNEFNKISFRETWGWGFFQI